jgi:FMN-dependent dehydrogenase
VYLDGGVRSGADVAAAVVLGARAACIARPYLYALMAGGELGVDHLSARLAEDYARTPASSGAEARPISPAIWSRSRLATPALNHSPPASTAVSGRRMHLLRRPTNCQFERLAARPGEAFD